MFLNHQKLGLIKKIVNAKMTSAELKAVSDKAEEILTRRDANAKKKE